MQKRDLISGWNESKVKDPVAFASFVGWSHLVLSGLLAIVTVAWALQLIPESVFDFLLVAASLVPLIALFRAKVKYGR
ncbi:hypothetical protein KR51_00002210 [Rubidibacter lacunae KORDI 51-2]|uniref:Uncharacterized protein n=1 Tax=Rubidibacter lacunae KORDI 51-2 TaxID=582515 RepID=U5DPY0_9CHRO|nr:hypothetical protein KR51_00002210 [Rubidibacter lacunae KORDI 51-2]